MKIKDIKVKILLWYMGIIFFILLSFSVSLIYTFYAFDVKHLDIKLTDIVHDIRGDFSEHVYDKDSKYGSMDEGEEFKLDPFFAHILKKSKNKQYEVIGSSPDLKNELLSLLPLELTNTDQITFKTTKNLRIATVLFEKYSNQYILQVATTINPSIATADLLFVLMILNPIILLFALLAGFLFVKRLFNPVRDIIKKVNKIQATNLHVQLKQNGSNDEIDMLISTFNKLFLRLENSFTKIKRFSHNASHELKTPLTILRGEIEVALRKTRTNEEYEVILKKLLDEVKSLSVLIDNLLLLSYYDQKTILKLNKKFILKDLITEVLESKHQRSKSKNIDFDTYKLGDLSINTNYELFKIVMNNLIDNALKYSNDNSTILFYQEDDTFYIVNEGETIPKDEIKFIFDSFYKSSKTRQSDGHGLGLCIVRSILDILGFKISIKSDKGINKVGIEIC